MSFHTHFLKSFVIFQLLTLMHFLLSDPFLLLTGAWCFDWSDFFNGFIFVAWRHGWAELRTFITYDLNYIKKNITKILFPSQKHVFEMKITLGTKYIYTIIINYWQLLFVYWSSSFLYCPLFTRRSIEHQSNNKMSMDNHQWTILTCHNGMIRNLVWDI